MLLLLILICAVPAFAADGFEVVEPEDFADVYVVNSCTVTASGDKKTRQLLRRLKKRLAELESREAVLELATPERVRAEIAHMAFDDIGRYLRFYEGDKGFEVHARCSDEIDTRNISEVSVGTGGKVTLKLYSRERALLKLWDILRQIPYGTTMTYGEIAGEIAHIGNLQIGFFQLTHAGFLLLFSGSIIRRRNVSVNELTSARQEYE